jgi:hypothetical protein
MKQINAVLADQFTSVWSMLEKTIDNIPEEKWHQGVGEWFFSLTAYHVIETAEFYIRESPEGMKWGGRAEFQWKKVRKIEEDVLPKITRSLVSDYLKDVKAQLETTLERLTDEGMLSSDGFEKHLSTRLEKFIYLLRHCGHHIGELNRSLREWNCIISEWD